MVYEIQCGECEEVYVSKTDRTLKKWISEHKQAVKRRDKNKGRAVYVKNKGHSIKWEKASDKTMEIGYWKRRV